MSKVTDIQLHALPAKDAPLSSWPIHLDAQRVTEPIMEIALIVILFLVGSVGGAMQALKYVERRRKTRGEAESSGGPSSDKP